MSKCLVVYYSRTGNTAKVAQAIAAALGADIDQIRESRDRRGFLQYLRAGFEALRRRPAAILPPAKDPADYDFVILGTPVWAGQMASPVRGYIDCEKGKLRKVAFFCTLGGANGVHALEGMRSACGRATAAEMMITAAALKSGAWQTQMADFVRRLPILRAVPAAA